MKIGIGIDTGGTCTDAVAYDFDSGTLLGKGKALTTRENLSVGIGRALDKLPPEYIRDASLISLSTTLATNACVENPWRRRSCTPLRTALRANYAPGSWPRSFTGSRWCAQAS